jgi:hypothetical protein
MIRASYLKKRDPCNWADASLNRSACTVFRKHFKPSLTATRGEGGARHGDRDWTPDPRQIGGGGGGGDRGFRALAPAAPWGPVSFAAVCFAPRRPFRTSQALPVRRLGVNIKNTSNAPPISTRARGRAVTAT